MTIREYYEVLCYSLYQNYKGTDNNYTLETEIWKVEKYLRNIHKDAMFYYKAGSVSASLLSNVGFPEYKNAAGGIEMFEKLIELTDEEELYK